MMDKPIAWLELPRTDFAPATCASLQYGAGKVASAHCGLRHIPQHMRCHWQHGWHSPHLQVDPRLLNSDWVADRARQSVLVARKDEESYLKQCGYLRAQAIGLPIIYLPERRYHRRPGSLLVMPTHSLEYTRHHWRFDEYAEVIASIRPNFSEIVVCVHPACVKKGYWVREFVSRGLDVIVGAHAHDRNALERVRALMSQFEFVTTNGYGSLIAYGAAFGAKVSIFGPFSENKLDDFVNDGLYCANPGLLEKSLPLYTEDKIKEIYPFLFGDPAAANEHIEWGRMQIGFENRLAPAEMKRTLGWTLSARCTDFVARESRMVASRILPNKLERPLKEFLNPAVKAWNAEIARLQGMPAKQHGTASLDGQVFHFDDGPSFYGNYRKIFEQHCFHFPCVKASPTIIDCGANIGLAVRYWMRQFPAPRIIAFESDTELFSILQRNCMQHAESGIALHNAAVWNTTGYQESELGTGRLRAAGMALQDTAVKVQTLQLSTFLDNDVDFLKIDIGGAEVEVILECSAKLGNVQALCIHYHSFLGHKQRGHEILEVLADAGFRYHIAPVAFSERPLDKISAASGMDLRFNIWGYRGDRFPRTIDGNS